MAIGHYQWVIYANSSTYIYYIYSYIHVISHLFSDTPFFLAISVFFCLWIFVRIRSLVIFGANEPGCAKDRGVLLELVATT